jgi:hypothetical protein
MKLCIKTIQYSNFQMMQSLLNGNSKAASRLTMSYAMNIDIDILDITVPIVLNSNNITGTSFIKGGLLGKWFTIVKLVEVQIQDMCCNKCEQWSSNHDPCSLISHIKSSQDCHNEAKPK